MLFNKRKNTLDRALLADVRRFIDGNLEPRIKKRESFGARKAAAEKSSFPTQEANVGSAQINAFPSAACPTGAHPEPALVLDLDESFAEMLFRKIDELCITDAECYKRAHIDRKLFSKIRSDRMYKPSKATAIAFVIALELPLEEAADMLKKAGFALSHSSVFDLIIEYFIVNRRYNVSEINDVLYEYDQPLLPV